MSNEFAKIWEGFSSKLFFLLMEVESAQNFL